MTIAAFLNASVGPETRAILTSASAATIAGMGKRGYSTAFTPHGDSGKRYLLDQIPAGLWADVKTKCKRDGISIRALILKLLTDWLKN